MRFARSLISFALITFLVGLGFLVLSTDKARAQTECIITIEKVAMPEDDTEFNFLLGDTDNFILKDPSDNTEIIMIDIGTSISVGEEVPQGWILEEITCSKGELIEINEFPNGRGFNCISDDIATCTFFNVKEASPIEVPTLSEWGLIAMAGILGIVGFMVIRRRKLTA